MNLLGQVLPAARELRVPLAVGYTWLAAAWLWFGNRVPRGQAVSPGSLADLVHRALAAVGVVGALAALSFVAYLFGSLYSDVLKVAVFRTWRWTRRSGSTKRRRAWNVDARSWAVRATWFDEQKGSTLTPTFEDLQRTQAEAQLRIGLIVPLCAVGAGLALEHQATFPAAITALAAVVFAWHGMRLLGEAARTIQLLDTRLGDEYDRWEEFLWE